MINFLLLISRQGKTRLTKWYQTYSAKEKARTVREITSTVLARAPKMCNFVEWRDKKIVYKRYASLFFVACIDQDPPVRGGAGPLLRECLRARHHLQLPQGVLHPRRALHRGGTAGKFEEGGVASMLSDGRADGGSQGGSGERKPGAIPPPVTATHAAIPLAIGRAPSGRLLSAGLLKASNCCTAFECLHIFFCVWCATSTTERCTDNVTTRSVSQKSKRRRGLHVYLEFVSLLFHRCLCSSSHPFLFGRWRGSYVIRYVSPSPPPSIYQFVRSRLLFVAPTGRK
ncbi:unnamed protein product [Ectocarpus sp. 8 AP-2014]